MDESLPFDLLYQSGQSLIEHSYKADSDLSPGGWEYAERLKEFVTEHRAKSLEQRGFSAKGRRLVVGTCLLISTYSLILSLQIWTSTRRRAHHTAWPFLTTSPPLPISSPPLYATLAASAAASTPTSPPHTSGSLSLRTTVHTPRASSALNVRVIEKPQMAEINPGVWDGLSPDQARKYYPDDWERFSKDPYSFRAPRAESYHDLSGSKTSRCMNNCSVAH